MIFEKPPAGASDAVRALIAARDRTGATAMVGFNRRFSAGWRRAWRLVNDADFGRKLSMHISWSNPQWIARDDVPADVASAEREIYANSDEVLSKPEQAREKIVDGMLNKRFFGVNVLLEQEWIHDSSKTVAQALADAGAEVLEFQRFSVAG